MADDVTPPLTAALTFDLERSNLSIDVGHRGGGGEVGFKRVDRYPSPTGNAAASTQ
ncbi:MAG: hypothetical protein R2710_01185 [Acidimicrobiales bacterium]